MQRQINLLVDSQMRTKLKCENFIFFPEEWERLLVAANKSVHCNE